jgi:hypothetical protein
MQVRVNLYWGYLIILWLIHLGISWSGYVLTCAVVDLTCFVMCECVGFAMCASFVNVYLNLLRCVPCMLWFLYCFVYVYVLSVLPPSDNSSAVNNNNYYYFLWLCRPARAVASSFTRFRDHTQRRATVGRTPLDEWLARRKECLTNHNTHNKQTSNSPGGIRTHDFSRRAAVDLRLRPRGHWDRLSDVINNI